MQKRAAALRSTDTLPPVILLLCPPALPVLRPCTAGESPSANPQRRKTVGTCSRWAAINPHSSQTTSMSHHPLNCTPATHQKTNLALPSSLFAGSATDKTFCVRSFSDFRPLHSVSEMAYMCLFACASACVFGSAYIFKAAVRHKKRKKETAGRSEQHTQITHITHTHAAAEWVHSTTK
ncbi:hypothetical protein TCDM_09552 [Trypanosoma cruzi Dm28c]|uniref:Transmembrane protein n=1 Tax=Trypanosoma cruzi Dm28c TaxID=1416333 RepID=V5BE88_TRYCR|nr:hypothetical protein TCDM_09552 [Trypanosoma cruzi Dm28c]